MSIAVEKPVHKRYRKYGETAHLLEPVYQDTRQNGQQRAVRVALLLIAQPTGGAAPSQTLLQQAGLIEEAALDSPSFVRDTLMTWYVTCITAHEHTHHSARAVLWSSSRKHQSMLCWWAC